MPVFVRADVDHFNGWAKLSFPFDRPTIAILKQHPGAKWDPEVRSWFIPTNLLPLLRDSLKIHETLKRDARAAEIPAQLKMRLRDYQIEGSQFLIARRGALLTMDMRTGKTPTAISAACALMASGAADSALVLYPNSVVDEWRRQLEGWANLTLFPLEGLSPLEAFVTEELQQSPWLVLGCHYEILAKRGDCLRAVLAGRKYVLIADEVHQCKNRKIERTQVLWELASAENCVGVYGLSGTPMRNRPRDLFALFELVSPGSMGRGYWTFAKRYCDAHQDDLGHWDDKGRSNEGELAVRLASVSYRKTRAEVAAWLPKSDRKVIFCAVDTDQMKRYRKLERHFATQVRRAVADADPMGSDTEVLRQLVQATSDAKIPTALERAHEHADRGVKVIVFAHFHETLQTLDREFDAFAEKNKDEIAPHLCAGGWMTPIKRRENIERWRTTPGPAVLLANTLSSGVGIDLADAEVALFLELEWVPADFRQAEDRIQDVHQGKRKTSPIYEYLLIKGTVDETMAAAILAKVQGMQLVVGQDTETGGVATTLRGAGVVDSSRLGLENTATETVRAALRCLRERWLHDDGTSDTTAESLAQDFTEVWEDNTELNDMAEATNL